jgi:hypothetical protein
MVSEHCAMVVGLLSVVIGTVCNDLVGQHQWLVEQCALVGGAASVVSGTVYRDWCRGKQHLVAHCTASCVWWDSMG